MNTFRLRMIAPLGLMGLSLALLPAAGAEDKKPEKKPVAATAKSSNPAPAGMIAVKDADTGQFQSTPPPKKQRPSVPPVPCGPTQLSRVPRPLQGLAGPPAWSWTTASPVFAVATEEA